MKKIKLSLKQKMVFVLFVGGLLLGIFTLGTNEVIVPAFEFNEFSSIKRFVNTFTINIWSFLIVWYIGYHLISSVFNYIFIFLKGYVEGITLLWVIKSLKSFEVQNLINYIVYLLTLVSFFIFLVLKNVNRRRIIEENKNKTIIIIIGAVALYSLVVVLIGR